MDDRNELEGMIEDALTGVFKDAFPDAIVGSWSDAEDRGEQSIGIRAESQGEELPGTGIHSVEVSIRCDGFNGWGRAIIADMIGTGPAARCTLADASAGRYILPQGQAVTVMQTDREAERESRKVSTYNLQVSIQSAELAAAA